MKYIVLIGDGMGDYAYDELNGQTLTSDFSSPGDVFYGKWTGAEGVLGGTPPPPEPIEPRYNPVP
jgi:hypothetical protein